MPSDGSKELKKDSLSVIQEEEKDEVPDMVSKV
jgi:hypothetical protein